MTVGMVPAEVQGVYDDALAVLSEVTVEGTDIFVNVELEMLRGMLTLYKAYTASSNSIPALGGMGLEGSVEIAQKLISEGYNPRKRYIVLRNLHKGFTA